MSKKWWILIVLLAIAAIAIFYYIRTTNNEVVRSVFDKPGSASGGAAGSGKGPGQYSGGTNMVGGPRAGASYTPPVNPRPNPRIFTTVINQTATQSTNTQTRS